MERFARPANRFNLRTILDFNDVDKDIQIHLKNVYSTLTVGLMLAAAAAYAFMLSPLLQSMTTTVAVLSFISTLGSMLYIIFVHHSNETLNARLTAFAIFAVGTGLGLGPLVWTVAALNPDTIPTALLGTALIFVSFTLASLLTRKRYYLFLGGVLMTAISMLSTFSFMNIFIRSPALYQAELYIGLGIFCLFVIFDTQLVVEKRRSGDTDFVWHALDLFLDFVSIFRHLLVILNSKRNRRNEDD
jgi:FtsH-binding integral membrane protein